MSMVSQETITGITADGDPSVTVITLSYDAYDSAHLVERVRDGDHDCSELFSDLEEANRIMDEWVARAKNHYEQERRSYEKGLEEASKS